MDFFQQQDAARRKTGLLVFYFMATVVLIILTIYAVFAGIFLATGDRQSLAADPAGLARALWDPQLFAGVGAATLAVIGGGSLYRVASLSGGGHTVAEMLRGRLVSPDTVEPAERRLLNVVEEMAIAAGVPVPPVYILDHEAGINAFAAGKKPGDAVIGITGGAVESFDRDELQGVIAHEFSHILNGDMRLNLRLMGVLFGIVAISTIGWILLRSSSGYGRSYSNSGDRKGGNPLPLIGLALYVIGYVGVIGGRLIKAAVSRQREYLADASAVQFTRNPGGIADALKQIGAQSEGSRIQAPEAEEASHMFFGQAIGVTWFGLMATHPPLVERIRRIEPNFDGDFRAFREAHRADRRTERPEAGPVATGRARATPLDPVTAITRIGTLDPQRLAMAAAVLDSLPSSLDDAAREPYSARAAVFAVLIDREQPEVREAQLRALAQHVDPPVVELTRQLLPEALSLPEQSRLPLVELTLPALRRMSKPQYDPFKVAVRSLMEADRRIDLFEFALHKLLLRHLTPQFEPERKAGAASTTAQSASGPATVLLAAVAQAGQTEPGQVLDAYGAGLAALGWPGPGGDAEGLITRPIGLPQVQTALDALDGAAPDLKRDVLRACAATIARDGLVTIEEGELLRAISDSLGCPMPPLVGVGGPAGPG